MVKATEFGTYILQKHPAWKVEMLHPKGVIFNVANTARVFIDEGPDTGVWNVKVHISHEGTSLTVMRRFPESWNTMFSPEKFGEEIASWVNSIVKEAYVLLKRISSQPEGGV